MTIIDEDERALRRLAIQLAVQLPADLSDAERVLEHARSLARFTNGADEVPKVVQLRPVSG